MFSDDILLWVCRRVAEDPKLKFGFLLDYRFFKELRQIIGDGCDDVMADYIYCLDMVFHCYC